MRTMYDAVTAANIPGDAQIVAGYIDKIKLEPWSAGDWARFPNAVKVQIVKKASTNAGHVLDVEPGDATPGEAPGWVRMRRAAGADPTVYCSLSTWGSVRQAFRDQGVPEPHYWIAHYDGDSTIPAGAVAKQYRGNVAPGIDISSVADYWPGVDDNAQGALVATPEEIQAIAAASATATVNEWMSRLVEVADSDPKRYLPASGMLTWTNGDTAAIRAAVTQLAAKVDGASATDIAAALLPALTAAITAELAHVDTISDADAQQIAQAVTDRAAALLHPAA